MSGHLVLLDVGEHGLKRLHPRLKKKRSCHVSQRQMQYQYNIIYWISILEMLHASVIELTCSIS